jgi:hypothetical protein
VRTIIGRVLAISAISIALLPSARLATAQPAERPGDKQPACAALKSEQACRAREDCHWVPPVMTNVPRPAHCREKPTGPPGLIIK